MDCIVHCLDISSYILAIIVLSIGGVLLMLYILKCILFPCTPEKHLIDTETGHEIVEKWY